MNINTTILFLDKQLKSLRIKPDLKAKILQTVTDSFKFTVELEDFSSVETLIDSYANEIVKVVAENSNAQKVCKDYTAFAIKNILKAYKEKENGTEK